ncbi:hypothetical protein QAD02_016186 [Eretmocerus hayati]|uniref:Uncharacterized protein n=1 Tax=Eretmocerus hayati TaxID=131215 RepID=A0ACC2PAS1_9HYME|nr:hypothetical protein QAD02_016186 [Eretmocerus hayati]
MRLFNIHVILILISNSLSLAGETSTTMPSWRRGNFPKDCQTTNFENEELEKIETNEVSPWENQHLRDDNGSGNKQQKLKCGFITEIPDALNAEEKVILRNLEQQNEEQRQLGSDMEKSRHSNSRGTNYAPPFQYYQDGIGEMKQNILGLFRTTQNVPGPSESDTEISARLESGRRKFLTVLENWEAARRDAQRRIRYGVGPCNGCSDEPGYYGISDRILVAGFEGNDQNLCNHVNELRMEIERIIEEADDNVLRLQGSRCNNRNAES